MFREEKIHSEAGRLRNLPCVQAAFRDTAESDARKPHFGAVVFPPDVFSFCCCLRFSRAAFNAAS